MAKRAEGAQEMGLGERCYKLELKQKELERKTLRGKEAAEHYKREKQEFRMLQAKLNDRKAQLEKQTLLKAQMMKDKEDKEQSLAKWKKQLQEQENRMREERLAVNNLFLEHASTEEAEAVGKAMELTTEQYKTFHESLIRKVKNACDQRDQISERAKAVLAALEVDE